MNNIIEIKNLSFRYNDKFIFDKLNMSIHNGEWLSIVGPNGSGKSTLVKILVGLLPNYNDVTIDDLKLNESNIMAIREKIGIVFENANEQFVAETVRDDMTFSLENLLYKPEDINHLVNDMARKMKIEDLLDSEPHRLSGGEKQKVAIASALITKPKILILDEALSMIDRDEKEDIINILASLHKHEHLTIINITHNLEETYKSNRIIVLNKGDILVEGPTKEVLKEEKIFNRIGIELPFIIDLSLKLNLYGLLDEIIFDMDEMVNKLWK